MKRLLLILVLGLGLAACADKTTTYNDAAVQAKAVELVSNRELLAPNGGPISPDDLAAFFQIIRTGCQSKENLQAMSNTLARNPYLLAQAFKLAQAGCPDVVKALGVTVNG